LSRKGSSPEQKDEGIKNEYAISIVRETAYEQHFALSPTTAACNIKKKSALPYFRKLYGKADFITNTLFILERDLE
jgi:hypothetical protein